MNHYILETHSLTKIYGEHKALDSINIHVKKGAIYGLIGRNGAGKTTTMKVRRSDLWALTVQEKRLL